MHFKLISNIALNLLLARWKQTLVAAIGVTFSIAMFITLLSFMTGLNDMLDGLIINRTPHIRMYNDIKPSSEQPVQLTETYKGYYPFVRSVKSANSRQEIYNSGSITQSLQNDDRVLGFAPKIITPIFFNDGPINLSGVLNGINVTAESRLFHFTEYVTRGQARDIGIMPNSIILGKGLADKLLANIGDVIFITTAQGEQFSLRVVGFFQSGLQDFDKSQSFASLSTVQKIMGKDNQYMTDIQVKLKDLSLAPAVAREFTQRYHIDAEDIQTANAQFETGSKVRTIISYAVGITLLIVAGFGIYNILNMMIYEKMDSIAILKATGFAGKDVKRIFLVIALSIGFFGGLAGLLFGFGLSVVVDQIPFNTAALPTIKTFPINYNPMFYVIATAFSLITTYFAGWFPARKASQVDPVIIIRGK